MYARGHWPLIVLALGIFAWLVVAFWPFTVDDAFITFRYSQNLAGGYGPTYNVGEPPIEGYTTFLWMLIMAPAHLLVREPVVLGKLLGVVFALALLGVEFALVRHLAAAWQISGERMVAAVAVLLLACYHPTAVHAVAGMETALFALLLMLFLYHVTLFASKPGPGLAAKIAFAALLTGLTRPEGNLAAIAGITALMAMSGPKQRKLLLKACAIGYVLPALAYFGWRLGYYGHLFPLPFYIKTTAHPGLAGLGPVLRYLKLIGLPLLVLAIPGLARADKRIVPGAVAMVALGAFFLFPEHLMSYDFRYLYPVSCFLIVPAALGIGAVAEKARSWLPAAGTLQKASAALLLAALLVVATAGYGPMLAKDLASKRRDAEALARAHVRLGKCLRAFGLEAGGPLVVAVGDAGAIPYFSRWLTIDTFGLNNPNIALQNDRNPDHVLQPTPDLVVLVSSRPDSFNPLFPWEEGLYEECLRRRMERVGVCVAHPPGYYLWLMAEPQSALGSYLAESWPGERTL